MSTRSYEQAVAGWAAHLRSGGTTTWSAWRSTPSRSSPGRSSPVETPSPAETPSRSSPAETPGRSSPVETPSPAATPDAAHLELVRRLNELGPADPGLSELVFATPATGRGMVDVPLAWPEAPRRFGFPPVEPELLPAEELIRLAVGVLARLLPDVPCPEAEPTPTRWALPWRRRFRLHGSPGTVTGVRGLLLDQGLVESDRRPTHVVIGRPLEAMMAEHWAAAVRDGGILTWSTLWRRAVANGLPGRIDIAAIAEGLTGGAVHVVVARESGEAAELTARLLRASGAPLPGTGDPAESDLARRLNRLLALTHGPEEAPALTGALFGSVLSNSTTGAGTHLAAPDHARAWAEETAVGMAERLRDADYAVHGDPDDLVPSPAPGSTGTIDRDRTLGLALTACLRAWQLRGGPTA